MDRPLRVWVVDDDHSVRWVLEKALNQAEMETRSFERAEHFLAALEDDEPDVLITDVRMPGIDGFGLLDRLGESCPDLPVIVVTAHSDLDNAIAAYRGGAFEYLPKPFDVDEAVRLVEKAARQKGREAGELPDADEDVPSLIGQAPAMQEVFRSIGRLSRSSMTVLITGESGTGKELVAQALHKNSPRTEQSFVPLNTSAIAAELLESELFGHERGAFTGADARRIGRFEQADGGTLFLDEIGDMSAGTTNTFAAGTRGERVLSRRRATSDQSGCAGYCSSNQDLARAVKEGRFREDLYHRLNVIRINTPPLRPASSGYSRLVDSLPHRREC